jgi:hypothetical protein
MKPNNARDLLLEDLDSHVVRAVGLAACELEKDAGFLRGLAKALDELSTRPMVRDMTSSVKPRPASKRRRCRHWRWRSVRFR